MENHAASPTSATALNLHWTAVDAATAPVVARQPDWKFGGVDSKSRNTVEQFIASAFKKAYGACLTEFMPELVALYHDAALVAACGLRPANTGRLFLEQYLNHSAETTLPLIAGKTADRSHIVEVGNLSVARPGHARHLIIWLTRHLYQAGHQWALFSAVPALRNNFLRLEIPLFTLGLADPERLTAEARSAWGTYYDQQPLVTAVHVATAFAAVGNAACDA